MQGLLNRPLFLMGKAFVELQAGRLEVAREFMAEARRFADERAMRYLQPTLGIATAEVDAALGLTDKALAELSQAESLARAMNLRPTVIRACSRAAHLLDVQGRSSDAELTRERARAAIRDVADQFADPARRDSYLEHTRAMVKPTNPSPPSAR